LSRYLYPLGPAEKTEKKGKNQKPTPNGYELACVKAKCKDRARVKEDTHENNLNSCSAKWERKKKQGALITLDNPRGRSASTHQERGRKTINLFP